MEHNGASQSPPSWFQPPTNRRRRHRPSPIINPVALILFIPMIALLILFFLVPPFLSHTNQILRPNKKSWDSLNIALVLFAILCGVFARRNDQTPPSVDSNNVRPRQSAPAWMHFPDQTAYNDIIGDVTSGGRLKRSSSSYPDLRHESLSESGGGNRPLFLDDFQVNSYRNPRSPENSVRRPPQPPKSPDPPPPPQPTTTLKRRRSVHSVPNRENVDRCRDEAEVNKSVSRRPAPPPPPPPEFQLTEVVIEKVDRKKTGSTKEIATSMASYYKSQGKRKKRGKNRNIYETATQNSSVEEPRSAPPPPPPPPPPPSPPSKLLQNLFKKSSKSKRVHSIPPPPPLPPNSIFNSLFKTVGIKSKRSLPPPPPLPPTLRRHLNVGKPPKPAKAKPRDEDNNKVFIAPRSPLIPPPPPPPPFRMTKPRFVARGDFVRIRSAHSSRGSSPELEDFDVLSVKSDSVGNYILCPSPDVNVKADTFIARLRGEWRLEKINSVKEI